MAYEYYNPNPENKMVGDCVIRALCKVLNMDWDAVMIQLSLRSLEVHDVPTSYHVWGKYLRENGFRRYVISNTCPDCYTVKDFARDHRIGVFVLATSAHVLPVIDGTWFDTADSGNEVAIFYYRKEM